MTAIAEGPVPITNGSIRIGDPSEVRNIKGA